MQCPQCRSDNPADAKFCNGCGINLEFICPACEKSNPPDSKFCNECGRKLTGAAAVAPAPPAEAVPESPLRPPQVDEAVLEQVSLDAGRKYVTVLFTDLSGYTALSEKLDPEEVKEIMSRIFGQIARIVSKYEGFIEKYIGDAVMALFGVPEAHEDDPVRAIWAAKEIHDLVKGVSPEVENKIGRALAMHTGINTGLVVTGEVNHEAGSHGVLGDTINIAGRLMGWAKPDEIIVTLNTYQHAQGYFHFESLEPLTLKGKSEPVQAYKALAPREQPLKTHRLSGLRAELIGRKAEMELLGEAVAGLLAGKGAIIAVSGEPGTGKSRLIEEFKATLDLSAIQWREGHAYAFAQKIPYFPLINILSRAWQIKEGDSPAGIREKIETSLRRLVKDREDLIPYMGSLFSLPYAEIEGINPESWKSRLQEAVMTIFTGFASRAPTIICLEDLHWADPSFIELLRLSLFQFRGQALFLLAFRPPFSLFTSRQVKRMQDYYREIRLQDLSRTESQRMVQSLLRTGSIPPPLKGFVQEVAEGNPFYLEEVINALIEAGILICDQDEWVVSRPIEKSDIPSSIQEVLAARLDRLDRPTKRVLQEASVIGRAFLYDVLSRVSALKDNLNQCLSILERLDLIRIGSLQPDLEYHFKHALIQEVVCHGLLNKERRAIHERIGLVMEEIYHHRLSEFYETLAYHFKHGQSDLKAVHYLIKSAEKSLERYALNESQEYFREAFELLSRKTERSPEENHLLIDLISKWFLVYYYRGDFSSMVDLLTSHRELAESLGDEARLGMFYACLGFALYWGQEKLRESYQLLNQALALGEKIDNPQVRGYAATWLSWVCADLGLFAEGIHFGQTAQEIASVLPGDQYLYFKSLGGEGHNYWQMGEGKKTLEIGKTLQDFGRRHANVRSMVTGHIVEAAGYFACGDFPQAIKCAKEGIAGAADPFYDQWAKIALSISFVFQTIKFAETEELLEEVLSYSRESGCNYLKTMANLFMGVLLIAKGNISRGFLMIEEVKASCLANERRTLLAVTEYVLGRIYLQISEGHKMIGLLALAKNIRFLISNAPFANKKAEYHLRQAVEIAEEIGAKGILGQAYLDLGLLKKKRGKTEEAKSLIDDAVGLFEACEAQVYLKLAREARRSLE